MTEREDFIVKPITFGIIGIMFFCFGALLIWFNHFDFGSLFITGAIGVFAYGLSVKTDKMTKAIAYSTFKETIGEFEDRRLTIRDKNLRIHDNRNLGLYNGKAELELDIRDLRRYASFSIWKCYTYFLRAMIFKEYLRRRDRTDLIDHINLFFGELVVVKEGFGLNLIKGYKDNLENMYNEISRYDVYEENSTRKREIRNRLAFLQSK